VGAEVWVVALKGHKAFTSRRRGAESSCATMSNIFRRQFAACGTLDFKELVVRSLIAGSLSTPFRDASAGVMVLFAVVHLDWLDGAA
jgi:hypothetical protein